VAGVTEPTTVFRTAFPNGTHASYEAAGVTGEIQLPTRWVTLIAKYYSGQDLRWFFGGQVLISPFNDFLGFARATAQATGTPGSTCTSATVGTPCTGTAFSLDGSSTATFGFNAATGAPFLVPQRPIRSQGGFVNLGFPLSRIFNANPAGRNAGWQFYLHWGVDEARAKDVARLSANATDPAGLAGNRQRGDMWAATLYYKLNNWVSFSAEQTLYRTHSIGNRVTGAFTTLYRGIGSHEWHDNRTEIGTIFTF